MSEKKQWKGRKELSISELEDLWFANRNLEMARSIILAVKDFQKISLEEKLKFLCNVYYENSIYDSFCRNEKLKYYIESPLLGSFLFLLPEWKQEFADKDSTKLIFVILSHEDIYSHISVSAGQIKKFVHSYLNSVKKEDMEEHLIVEVLINNRMFEEMINYNFVSDETVKILWDVVFKQNIEIDYGYCYCALFKAYYTDSIDSKKREKKIKEFLLSWDKVKNRHALATLWTLLAKRGDLEKIFREPEPRKEVCFRDPDPLHIISG